MNPWIKLEKDFRALKGRDGSVARFAGSGF
jgi:hypothetical protein